MKKILEATLEKIDFYSLVARWASILAFTLLTIAAAHVAIPLPFTPVPLTLQTLFVLLSGAFLGSWAGGASQAGYLVLGILGLPVFAGGAFGIARLLGPTGGFLMGFFFASLFLGYFFKKENISWLKVLLGMFLATLIIHTLGLLQLAFVLRISLKAAFFKATLPFVLVDSLKIILASAVYKSWKKLPDF